MSETTLFLLLIAVGLWGAYIGVVAWGEWWIRKQRNKIDKERL